MRRSTFNLLPRWHLLRRFAWLGGTVLGCALLVQALAWLTRPTVAPVITPAPPSVAAPAEARLQVEVDYAAGSAAAWWPKGEAPACAALVAQGALPPVHERTGPEPLVLSGGDGVGAYGSTWRTFGIAPAAIGNIAAPTLLRWSPGGLPVVPHLARAWEASPDQRTFTFHLRRGMRWSDGAPFTSEDIRWWWDHEVNDPGLGSEFRFLARGGRTLRVEIVDAVTVRFVLDAPDSVLPYRLAGPDGLALVSAPAHYLRPWHPTLGDQAAIAREVAARRMPSTRELYLALRKNENPLRPTLSPWTYRHHQGSGPYTYERNPWYWAVDAAGNQLPYLDRVQALEVGRPELQVAEAVGGRIDFTAQLKGDQYPLLAQDAARGGYRVLRWPRGDRSDAVIHANLNRRIDPADASTRWKHWALNQRDFRRALSLAIDRDEIIQACYNGETEPAQVAPGPESPFHHPGLRAAFVQHDPAEAERLLDGLGLKRGFDGFRRFPDGSFMQFEMTAWQSLRMTIPQLVAAHWRRVGVLAVPRQRNDRLFYIEKGGLDHDFTWFTGNNEFFPLLEPRCHLPLSEESNFAIGFSRWYVRGGLADSARAERQGGIAPPADHPLRAALALWEQVPAAPTLSEQKQLMDGIFAIAADNVWTIGLCTSPDFAVVAREDFRNVPAQAVVTYAFLHPSNAGPELFFRRGGEANAATTAAVATAITTNTPPPYSAAGRARAAAEGPSWTGWIIGLIAVAGVVLLCLRQPFVIRRLLIIIPTLGLISVVVFATIELPPGDYVTAKIVELESRGEQVQPEEIAALRARFHLDESSASRYARWVGFTWFTTFAPADKGLLQGELGLSMAHNRPVGELIGDRLLLTVLLSLGTILLTWMIAVPIGMYSAVRPYSLVDHTLTLGVFIGMCLPSFLLALVLMHISQQVFGHTATGLLSPQWSAVSGWPWAKIVDLLSHLWLPAVVLAVTGTGGMIRVLRANLLDEIGRPYVTTARAKGVPPVRLLVKYPLRLALNPFVSGIGGVFPQLVSGGAIISIVMSLPTIGPMMLDALLNEDTQLAGSLLMILSALGVVGTLVSDLLLLWLDPRIRYEGGK